MTNQELIDARVRAKFYAEHPKETADMWVEFVLDAIAGGSDTTSGLATISPHARSQRN